MKCKKIIIFLFFLLILFVSCGVSHESNDNTADTTEKIMGVFVDPDVSHRKWREFPYSGGIILEWGDRVNFENSEILMTADTKFPIPEGEYVGFSVRYIHYFAHTAKDPYNYNKSPSQHNFFGKENRLLSFLDSEMREALLQDYDDVVIIKAEYADIIKKGRQDFVFMGSVPIAVSTGSEVDEPLIEVFTPMWHQDDRYGEPILLKMVDGKLVIEDRVDSIYEYLGQANEYLIDLGLADNLFRDGMTVEELEEYFELVTDSDTFAPLFED